MYVLMNLIYFILIGKNSKAVKMKAYMLFFQISFTFRIILVFSLLKQNLEVSKHFEQLKSVSGCTRLSN